MAVAQYRSGGDRPVKRKLATEGRVYVHYRDNALIEGGEHVSTYPDPVQIKRIGLQRTSSDPLRTYWIYSKDGLRTVFV